MCLSIATRRPQDVLLKSEHAGHEFVIIHNGDGYRCGYVKVTPGHPWFGKDYDQIECTVHGGLTFSEMDVPCGKGGPDDGYWIGFDCAHCGDLSDPELPSLPPSPYRDWLRTENSQGVVRSQEYVIGQCKSLCEQAKEAS